MKECKPQSLDRHFMTGPLFCTPPITSNEHSGVIARETLCSNSSTVPAQNVFHCNSFNDDGIDEVKNFRVNECSSLDIPRDESTQTTSETSSELRAANFTLLNSTAEKQSPIANSNKGINFNAPLNENNLVIPRSLSENDITNFGNRLTIKTTNL